MTTISLSLAKQIAGLYVRLGELAPLSELYFMQRKDSGEWELHHFFDPDVEWYSAYDTDELMEILPVGIALTKLYEDKYEAWHEERPELRPAMSNDPTEALGLMLAKVLSERVKEKGE